ncbi:MULTISPECIES: hypothetical protein [Mycolicibacterium]|uniref:hypothetical protein n=1 Tax=Mycolicibacterium TaxID=1866885 RepID=UPI001438B035|nr:hypothetical protein [Mycolicibacterium frederiksbergense]
MDYAFAIFNAPWWVGHNVAIAGYITVAVYLPDREATLAVVVNSDASKAKFAELLASTITSIVTPEHVYFL